MKISIQALALVAATPAAAFVLDHSSSSVSAASQGYLQSELAQFAEEKIKTFDTIDFQKLAGDSVSFLADVGGAIQEQADVVVAQDWSLPTSVLSSALSNAELFFAHDAVIPSMIMLGSMAATIFCPKASTMIVISKLEPSVQTVPKAFNKATTLALTNEEMPKVSIAEYIPSPALEVVGNVLVVYQEGVSTESTAVRSAPTVEQVVAASQSIPEDKKQQQVLNTIRIGEPTVAPKADVIVCSSMKDSVATTNRKAIADAPIKKMARWIYQAVLGRVAAHFRSIVQWARARTVHGLFQKATASATSKQSRLNAI